MKSASPKHHLPTSTLCPYPEKKFLVSPNLMSDIQADVYEKPFACTRCSMRFADADSYKVHLATHGKLIRCTNCFRRFNDRASHLRHRPACTGTKPFECTQCTMKFSMRGSLREHLRTHTTGPFACTQCGMGFRMPGYLKLHLRTHSSERKPFVCFQCDRRFTHQTTLKTHLDMHNIEERSLCKKCGKRLSGPKSLRKHLLTHSGTKKHLLTHSGASETENQFTCPRCSLAFSSSSSLKKHFAQRHRVKPMSPISSNLYTKAKYQCEKGFPEVERLSIGSSTVDEEVICDPFDCKIELADGVDYGETLLCDQQPVSGGSTTHSSIELNRLSESMGCESVRTTEVIEEFAVEPEFDLGNVIELESSDIESEDCEVKFSLSFLGATGV